jgi:hypothetical protein
MTGRNPCLLRPLEVKGKVIRGMGRIAGKKSKKSKAVFNRHAGAKGERKYSFSFVTSALDGGEWSASRPVYALPRERKPGTHWIGGYVGLRAGLDTEDRGKYSLLLPEIEPRLPSL